MKKEIKCSECDETFKTVIALKEHFAQHSGEEFVKPFKCRYCDKRFLYKHACAVSFRGERDGSREGGEGWLWNEEFS